jgi:nucleoside-diphosphate-sugar epimerase
VSRRILVTGGLGFLGGALTRALVRASHAVRVLDNGWRGSEERLGDAREEVEIVRGDIRDAAAVAAAVRGVDAVCHLAYINGTRYFYEMPARVLEVGVKGMINVIDACLAADVGELHLASSSEVYHEARVVPTDERVPLTIPDPLNPRYSYSGGKIVSELLAIHYGRDHFRRVVIVRPHNVYGPWMGWEHVIPEFVVRMKELARARPEGRIPFPIQGNGGETRAFIFVEDFAEAFLRVLEAGEHLGIYNIGTTEEVSIEAVARGVARCFGREIDVVPGELRAGSTVRRCPDVSRIAELGFAPRVPFSEGLELTVRWYDQHSDGRPKSPLP